jgi:AcrR family transcriptional regulator
MHQSQAVQDRDQLFKATKNDTNRCMNLSTRQRLIQAATRLFADTGYRGASVRDICNLAGANPGAVSYHFGGKRQLYRSVLRQAAESMAAIGPKLERNMTGNDRIGALDVLRGLLSRMQEDDSASRLLLRDLADGGSVAVEALTPPLRAAFEHLSVSLGHGDQPRASNQGRLLFLALAGPLFLLTVAWPVVARVLELETDQREKLLTELLRGTLEEFGGMEAPGPT